ncbi:MAG: aspartate/glutamate racemase family protein [Bacillota bacterium]|nr:aspartate/glutamate racemase family protein [Bacillota bacterium]
MFAYRAKLGIIYPAPGIIAEHEFFSVLPEGITICTTRIPLLETTSKGLSQMLEHASEAGALLAQAAVDIIAFLCTSGSLINGVGFDLELAQKISSHTGIKVITTATAVLEALNFFKAKKLLVLTPYTEEINKLEMKFLEGNGFEVLAIKGLGISDSRQMGDVDPGIIYRFCKNNYHSEADVLFISCTGIPTFSIINSLEEDIGIPVISSNQVSLWSMLKHSGVKSVIPKLGVLFSGK